MFAIWRDRLATVLRCYEAKRDSVAWFWPKLFGLFVVINVICYWIALLTAFAERLGGDNALRYVLIALPVGLLGAVFDIISLTVTVLIIRRALKTVSQLSYVAHLSIDLVIAAVATCWVLIVFSVSGWVVDLMAPELAERPIAASTPAPPPTPAATTPDRTPAPAADVAPPPPATPQAEAVLTKRGAVYKRRLVDAITDPFKAENLRNIYFGVVMGASAMLPTTLHLLLSLSALFSAARRRIP